ncbi:MAG: class I SAM-dependent methyltransferase [Bacteroidales bacterium]|nr:class I SAM-dependent methyltransferase [Bacteroidales bacterium]
MSTRQKLEKTAYIPKAWEEVSCPFCHDNDFRLLERFGDKMQYSYVLCKKCRLVYLNPRPFYDDEFVFDAYEFYAENDSRYVIREDFYENESRFEKTEVAEVLKYDVKRSAILDVGCAVGKFLYNAKTHYGACIGLDVSSLMAELIKKNLGIDVVVGKFETWETADKFSAINMSHVLEHFPHPELWLKKAASLLEDDGILIISVPNMFSADRKIKRFIKRLGLMKNLWESWRTPDHLFEPTIPAMKVFLKKNGFEIIDYYTYSRTKLNVNTFFGNIYHRKLRLGSNMKFFLKAQKH